jgi:hypothetical protein
MKSIRFFVLPFICIMVFAAISDACNVPVFRYALERWSADPYPFTVFFDDSCQVQQIDSTLTQTQLNAEFTYIDLSSNKGKATLKTNPEIKAPWMTIQFPSSAPVQGIIWQTHATTREIKKIITSPVREKIGKALLNGDASVWILLKSGQTDKDSRALNVLKTSLKIAEKQLQIPTTGLDIDGNPIPVTDFESYELRFDLVEIDPGSSDEDILIQILRSSEPDLAAVNDPLAFPVFGRGRALYALVGEGITRKNILESCQSIIDWCSCEVKALNPGLDLLMDMDWSHPAGGHMVDPDITASLTGLESFMDKDTTTAFNTRYDNDIKNNATRSLANPLARNLFITLIMVIAGVGYLFVRIKKHRGTKS